MGDTEMRRTGMKRFLMVLAAAVLAGILTGCSGGVKLDPTEYVNVVFSGLDGSGTAELTLDAEGILRTVEEKKDLTQRKREELEAVLSDAWKDFSLSESSGLSNGDKITVRSDMDKKALKEYGVSVSNGSRDFTVEGLIEETQVSLNDYISVDISGFEGHGTAQVWLDYDGLEARVEEIAASVAGEEAARRFLVDSLYKYMSGISISETYFENLSNGDEVSCSVGMEKDLIEEFGVRFVWEDISAKAEGLLPVTNISIADYIRLEAEGFDGHTYGDVSLDIEALTSDLEKIFTEQGRGAWGVLGEDDDVLQQAEDAAELISGSYYELFDEELTPDEDLSEGDTVTWSAALQDSEGPYIGYGFELEGGEKEMEVSGLVPVAQISLDDYIRLEAYGFDGDGSAEAFLDYEAMAADLAVQYEELGRGMETLAQEDTDFGQEGFDTMDELMSEIESDFICSLSDEEELSEGSPVTVSYKPYEEGEESIYYSYAGILVTGGERELTVTGLIPVVTVNLSDFLSPKFEGYSGAGTAQVGVDTDALSEYLEEQFRELGRGAYDEAYPGMDFAEEAAAAMQEAENIISYDFSISLSKEAGLSNGEVIVATCSQDEDAQAWSSGMGLYVNGGAAKLTVRGLDEPEKIDLADAVKFTFSGVAPDVTVSLETDSDAPYYYDTSLGDAYQGRIYAWNGDTYGFDIDYNAEELLRKGYVVSNSHAQGQISGLNSYRITAQSADAEPMLALWDAHEQEALDQIHSKGKGILDFQQEGGMWAVWSDSALAREKAQLQFASSEEGGTGNGLYLIYRCDVAAKTVDHSVFTYPVWYAVGMRNVQETPEGKILADESSGRLLGSREELEEYLAQQAAQLPEGVSVLDLEYPAEETGSSPEGEAQVGLDAAPPQVPSTGDTDAGALSRAAKVIEWQGHTYARYDEPLSWEQAETFCRDAGGHLASVRSDREQYVIRALLEDAPLGGYYLGGSDAEFEGAWTWTSGEPFDYCPWESGQPDNSVFDQEEEDCLVTGSRYGFRFSDRIRNAEDAGYILETDPAEEEDEDVWLTDLDAARMYYAESVGQVTDPYGNVYFDSLRLDASNRAAAEYDLDGKWDRLTGVVSTFPDAQSDAAFEIVIWGDDRVLFSRFNYRKTDPPMNVDLDLSGVQKLTIGTHNRGGYSYGYLFLNDMKLTPAQAQVPGTCAQLQDLPMIGNRAVDICTREALPTDSQGTVHRDAWYLHADEEGEVLFQLDGKYETFACTVFGEDRYGGVSAGDAEILADGEVLWSAEDLSVVDGYQEIRLDVSGARVLKVRTSAAEDVYGPMVAVADTFLTGPAAEKDAGQEEGTPEEALTEAETASVPAAFGISEEAAAKAAKYIAFEGKAYYRFDEPMSRSMALRFAQEAGGSLAAPVTEAEDRIFRKLVEGGRYRKFWLSGSPEYEFAMSSEDPTALAGFVVEAEDGEADRTPAESIRLTDLEWAESEWAEVTDAFLGNECFTDSVRLYSNDRSCLLADLNGQYGRLDAQLAAGEGNDALTSAQFAVFGDGMLLAEVRDIGRSSGKQELSIDVTGVDRLYIAAANTGEYGTADVILCSPRLYLSDEPASGAVTARLGDLTLIDSTAQESSGAFSLDTYGRPADRWQAIDADADGFLLYNLGGKFTTFSGKITAGQRTDAFDAASVSILADGQEVYRSGSWSPENGPEEFEVDVAGATTLEIRAASEDPDRGNMYVYITADRLTG